MSEFSERLEGLMSERNLNGKTLAQNVGISATCISHYLLDKHIPTVEHLVMLADYFNRSTDFLLGREEENLNLTFKTCPPFSEQIKFLKNFFKRTAYSIYNGTEVSKTCYYGWLSGKRQPTLENIVRLAGIFDCRVDFILGRES